MLCSDGLTDVFAGEGEGGMSIQEVADIFPGVLNRTPVVDAIRVEGEERRPNLALRLLREGLGGPDLDKVSSMLTLEFESKWIDDVTVLVQRL